MNMILDVKEVEDLPLLGSSSIDFQPFFRCTVSKHEIDVIYYQNTHIKCIFKISVAGILTKNYWQEQSKSLASLNVFPYQKQKNLKKNKSVKLKLLLNYWHFWHRYSFLSIASNYQEIGNIISVTGTLTKNYWQVCFNILLPNFWQGVGQAKKNIKGPKKVI